MQNCRKNIKKISPIFCSILSLLLFNKVTLAHDNVEITYNQNIVKQITMFSSRIVDTQELFIVKNDKAIIRTIKNKKFHYKAPDNICYNLENGANICITDGKIDKITGGHFSLANEDVIANVKYRDEFFTENSNACNEMKFDLANTIFINNQTINGFQTQMYLPDYYNLIKLVLFQPLENEITDAKDKQETNMIYAFIFSQNYDIGCSPFADYKLFKIPVDVQEGTKKKKKSKKIIAKNQKALLKKISTESYKKMLLKDYIYLQPASHKDEVIKIILSISKNRVTQINEAAINLQLSSIGEKELLSLPVKEQENKKSKKKNGKST